MASLLELQQLRQQYLNEIQRRGGKAKAPGFVAKLDEVEAQIRTLQQSPPQPISTPTPISQPPVVADPTPQGAAVDQMAQQSEISNYSTMNEADLMAERKQLLTEIERRGGKQNAPGFTAKLGEVDAALNAIRSTSTAPQPPSSDPNANAIDTMAESGSVNYSSMNETDLMEARQRTLNEIERRGGKANAPNYAKRLEQIDNALGALRGAAGVKGPPNGQRDPLQSPGAPVSPPPTQDTPFISPPSTETPPGIKTGDVGSGDLIPGQGPPPYNNIPGGPISQFPDPLPEIAKDVVTQTGGISNPQTAIQSELTAADYEAAKNLQLANPNQVNPFGNRAITRDQEGNITVTDSLSGGQQKILSNEEALSNVGRELAIGQLQSGAFGDVFNPQLAPRVSSGDLASDRQRYEDAIFAKFTRDQGEQKKLEEEQLRQRLYNQGIPFSADPESRYQQELKAFNKRYDTLRENAMQTATQLGGEEYQRNFGINEQLIANQLSQQQAVRNQRMGEVSNLSGLGAGLMLPNFQAYQAPTYNPANPTDIYATFEQLSDADKDRALQKWIASQTLKKSGGGGGGGGGSTTDSAFEGL